MIVNFAPNGLKPRFQRNDMLCESASGATDTPGPNYEFMIFP